MNKLLYFSVLLVFVIGCDKTSDFEKEVQVIYQSSPGSSFISFSGYNWIVKDTDQPTGPMNNYWSNQNVWVDGEGKLHLKITKEPNGRWTCAEVHSTTDFGYGTYVWQLESRVDQLDKNIVLGLFDYRGWQYDHYDEIDIEFARWGNDAWHNFNYTVYPAHPSTQSRVSYTNELSLNGSFSTYRFTRNSEKVYFTSFHGHTENPSNAFFEWETPNGFDVPQVAMPVHMNLWLFDALPPSDEQEIIIVIKSFEFRPL